MITARDFFSMQAMLPEDIHIVLDYFNFLQLFDGF